MFSRKDNLNKHRRIHPEINQQNSKQKSIKTETSPIDIKHMNAVEEDVKDNIKVNTLSIIIDAKKINFSFLKLIYRLSQPHYHLIQKR